MKILKLPVEWLNKGESEESIADFRDCGIDISSKVHDGFLYVNKDLITSFNETSYGTTVIRLGCDIAWDIIMPIHEFMKLLEIERIFIPPEEDMEYPTMGLKK